MRKWSKITPNKLYTDYFLAKYKRLEEHVVHWSVCGYVTLEIWLDDGRVFTYNATSNRMTFARRR